MRQFWGNSLAACSPITSLKLMLATLHQLRSWSLGLLVASRDINLFHVVLQFIRNKIVLNSEVVFWKFVFPIWGVGYYVSAILYLPLILTVDKLRAWRWVASVHSRLIFQIIRGIVLQSIYLWLKLFPMSSCEEFLFNLLLLILNTCSPKLSSVVLLHICSFSFVIYNEAQHFVTLGGLDFPHVGNSPTFRASGANSNERRQRSKKVCKVLDYGGVASKTSDIGPPILSAFAACKSGGTGTSHWLEAREVKRSSSR